jgi:adenylosuccinate lyase
MIKRYTRKEMGSIWSEREKYRNWLKIELLACDAQGVSPLDLQTITSKLSFAFNKANIKSTIKRIKELEKITRHEILAFLVLIEEKIGTLSKHVHVGLTSSDILDSALAIQLDKSIIILQKDLAALLNEIKQKAKAYKDLCMMGRTHGMHAELTTLGMKFLVWHDEIERNSDRLNEISDRVSAIKLRGAVGIYGSLEPFVEQHIGKQLGLPVVLTATQIIQRDRYAEYLSTLALIASSIEKIALEIRHLQRTEVNEVEEPFYEGQQGSSAMPHKHNPVSCENLCGLSRLMRSYVSVGLENNGALWHERDMSHSSTERVTLPDASITLDYMLNKMINIIQNLKVNKEVIEERAKKFTKKGYGYSEYFMLFLMKEKGMARQEAYKIVQNWCQFKFPNELGKYINGEEYEKIVQKANDQLYKNVNYIFEQYFGKQKE